MEAGIKNFCKTSIPFRERRILSFDGYNKSDGNTIDAGLVNSNLFIANTGIINKVIISGTLSPYFKLREFLDDEEDEENYKFQDVGEYPVKIGVEGVKQKKNLKFFVTTNKQISSIHIQSISTEFLLEYKAEIKDYLPELKEELESLCRMIMLEDDENLTVDAIMLKKNLEKYFQKNTL